jgi:WD40 repeat protein
VAFSADASIVVSGGNDRSVRLWEVQANKGGAVLTGHNAVVEAVVCSPKDGLIASGDADGRIRLWKPNGASVANFESRSPRVRSLAFSPDGRWLSAGGADGMVRLFVVAERREIAAVSAHKNTIYGVSFSPDGKLLASAGFDRTIRLWQVKAT